MPAYYERPSPDYAYKNLAELLRLFAAATPGIPADFSDSEKIEASFSSALVGDAETATVVAGTWNSVNVTNFSGSAATVNGVALPASGYVNFQVPPGMKAPDLVVAGVGTGSNKVRIDVASYSGTAPTISVV